MAYDSARQRTVLFGGWAGSYQADTWEWDGITWTQIKPTTSPGSLAFHAMAYDSARQRTVLLGTGPGAYPTWEWDGKTWTQIKPTTSPSIRREHAMAYDSARQRTVLFGMGYSASATWEWDGITWTQIKPTTSPTARDQHAMAYDSARQRTVLFGGWAGSFLADTWEWDGITWTQIKPTTSPTARTEHAMVYDSARKRTVLFGGRRGSSYHRDTWEWDGKTWTQIKPTTSPSIRWDHAMAYDSARQRTVLFGGYGSGFLGGTWEFTRAATPTLSGTITLGGEAASNVPVKFVSSQGTVGPVNSDSNGRYSFPIGGTGIPLNTIGTIQAQALGRTYYYYPLSIPFDNLKPSDLDVQAKTASGMDITIPSPVILLHGINPAPGRWKATVDEMDKDLKARIQNRLTKCHPFITATPTYSGLPESADIQKNAETVAKDVRAFRATLTTQFGVSSRVPINILAHSKGGLVARAYIHSTAVQSGDVDRLITLGTPHGGALMLCGHPTNEYGLRPKEIWGFSPLTGITISGSFGAVVTSMKGVDLYLVGSSQWGAVASSKSFCLWITLRSPGLYVRTAGKWWDFMYPYILQDDGVVTTWSSVVYPICHGPSEVQQAFKGGALVGDSSHESLPSTSTMENHVLRWLR